MKRTILSAIILSLVIIASPKHSHAQMGAAQTIEWNVSKVVSIKAEQASVWSLLSNLKEIMVYSKGLVKQAELKGTSLPFNRVLAFSDGSTRTEQIDQIEQEGKFIAYRFAKESLPKGINHVGIAVFTKANGDKTELKWLAQVEGSAEAKKELVAKLTTEFENYTSGMVNFFNNSVPAIKMN